MDGADVAYLIPELVPKKPPRLNIASYSIKKITSYPHLQTLLAHIETTNSFSLSYPSLLLFLARSEINRSFPLSDPSQS